MAARTRVEVVESDSIQCIFGENTGQQDLLVLVEVKESKASGMALRWTVEPYLDE